MIIYNIMSKSFHISHPVYKISEKTLNCLSQLLFMFRVYFFCHKNVYLSQNRVSVRVEEATQTKG
jgi:hypothetical protein